MQIKVKNYDLEIKIVCRKINKAVSTTRGDVIGLFVSDSADKSDSPCICIP